MTQQLTPKTAKEIFNDMRVGKCSNAQAEAAANRRGILAEYKAEYKVYGEMVVQQAKDAPKSYADLNDESYDRVMKAMNM